ncbi:magnesium-translocating P-type ATPase [Vagococcus silagei]|uniref:Magnesium-transporting ATPase, P-type 1 n=1 Tax=Vagococcus silagei TaxID=2508885 RepID=A0A4S3B3F5_9ENTE|nr:magnesium-translocating P-type ATPase [Vagococcus silagei]
MTQQAQKDRRYLDFSKQSINDLFKKFNSTLSGVKEDQVEDLREKYGENKISHAKQTPFIVEVLKAYFTPFTIVLLILAVISYVTDYVMVAKDERDLTGVLIIATMVFLSGTMSLIQSVKSNKSAEKLSNLVQVTATVIREDKEYEIAIEDLVCGDVINLSAGDMLPADLRLIRTKDLFISQAAMTGESYPVEKRAEFISGIEHENISVTDLENIAFMGSNVISGSAIGMIISVGNDTLFGQIAKDVSGKKTLTSFDLGISKTSWLLIRFMMVMAPAVFLINGLTKGDWLEAFLFGLSVAVGLTPEMLPMIVTTNLVKGASSMAKKGTIIKNLNAIQNFGAIDVLCTDKTGTLTQDKIILEYHLDIDGNEDNRVLHHAFFNSYFQTGLKNLMDKAIIESAEEELNIDVNNYQKVDEIPFDFTRRRMSVVIEDQQGKRQMITKGAIEEMLEISSHVDYQGQVIPLDETLRTKILKTVDDLNEDGLRVIGVSQKTNPSVVGEFSINDEADMVLIGYLAFLDPPKETTKAALAALKEHGVDVKVLTGDNELVTRSVCRQVGLDNKRLVNGAELSKYSDEELATVAKDNNIFVKLTPAQKTRLVRVLRATGHTVGFMGDGINDAPAMKEADVGISVDTAVDIAKESADVILLEKDLMVLERGLLAGRTTFGNIMKYVKMTASSNFGNMFSVVIASIFLPFLPMLPLQLLFLNLIYDISCMSIPWDNMDEEYLKEPKKWDASTIGSFMKWMGPTSSVFDVTTYMFLYFIICPAVAGGSFHSLGAEQQAIFIAVFHAGWFVESLWSQTLVIHTLRTPKVPFLQSNASFILTTVTSIGILVGSLLPFTEFGERLGLIDLPGQYWGFLAITIVAYLILVMVVKKIYVKRFGELL